MTINTNKYDGVHHQVVTMNMRDGSVQGHAAGCADLKRGLRKFAEPIQADYPVDVLTKLDAWVDYNEDFIAECDDETCDHAAGQCSNAYSIKWLPCASHVPDAAEVVEADAEVTMKVCGKWTRFYSNGVEVGRIHNDHFAGASALLAR